jgi:hypothetical protein
MRENELKNRQRKYSEQKFDLKNKSFSKAKKRKKINK